MMVGQVRGFNRPGVLTSPLLAVDILYSAGRDGHESRAERLEHPVEAVGGAAVAFATVLVIVAVGTPDFRRGSLRSARAATERSWVHGTHGLADGAGLFGRCPQLGQRRSARAVIS